MMARVRGVIERSMASKSSEVVLLSGDEAVGHSLGALELDLALVYREAGIRIEHFVAGVHEREEELLDHRLATRLHGDVLGP